MATKSAPTKLPSNAPGRAKSKGYRPKTPRAKDEAELLRDCSRQYVKAGLDPAKELAKYGQPTFIFNAGHLQGLMDGLTQREELAEVVAVAFVQLTKRRPAVPYTNAERVAWDKAYELLCDVLQRDVVEGRKHNKRR